MGSDGANIPEVYPWTRLLREGSSFPDILFFEPPLIPMLKHCRQFSPLTVFITRPRRAYPHVPSDQDVITTW